MTSIKMQNQQYASEVFNIKGFKGFEFI